MIRKYRSYVALAVFLVVMGCSSVAMKNTVAGYQAEARTLTAAAEAIRVAKGNQEIAPETINKAVGLYKQAYDAHYAAGDVIILMLQTNDAVKQNTLRTQYNQLIGKVAGIVVEILAMVEVKK